MGCILGLGWLWIFHTLVPSGGLRSLVVRASAEHGVLKVVEGDQDHCYIVKRAPEKRVLEDVLYAHAAHLVHVLDSAFH